MKLVVDGDIYDSGIIAIVRKLKRPTAKGFTHVMILKHGYNVGAPSRPQDSVFLLEADATVLMNKLMKEDDEQ